METSDSMEKQLEQLNNSIATVFQQIQSLTTTVADQNQQNARRLDTRQEKFENDIRNISISMNKEHSQEEQSMNPTTKEEPARKRKNSPDAVKKKFVSQNNEEIAPKLFQQTYLDN